MNLGSLGRLAARLLDVLGDFLGVGFDLSVELDHTDTAISLVENPFLHERLHHDIYCRLPLWVGSSVSWISELQLGLIGDLEV